MNLSLERINELVHGASYTEIKDDKLYLHRLTREQEDFLLAHDPSRLLRAECPAGITLEFTTNSRTLMLSFIARELTGRHQAVTVHVNGNSVSRLAIAPLPDETEMHRAAALGEGEKQVMIRLPGITRLQITGLTLDDGASVCPVPTRTTKLLLLGDSITQGYDAINPEESYAARLSLALNAEVRNRAIGGEKFSPDYALLRDDFEPDIITVAYGTNDWSHKGRELLDDCEGFFRNLRATYPTARIYALLPLWRNDHDHITAFGALTELNPAMRAVIEPIGGITVIDCFDAIPHEQAYFTDVVHPTAHAHAHYARALIPYIKV